MKDYSSKSAARKGAKRQGLDLDNLTFQQNEAGRWFWEEAQQEVEAPVEAEVNEGEGDEEERKYNKQFIDAFGTAYCPHCKSHLDNGVIDNEQHLADLENGEISLAQGEKGKAIADHIEETTNQFECMGCGGQFGPELSLKKGTGIKIEKDRPEQNGVVRPSAGGVCRAVWDFCDGFLASNGRSPLPKEIKEASTQEGWNVNNALIEMYQWRKFNGITGRVKA